MIDVTMEELKQLLLTGRRVMRYALDHHDELVMREAVYTLYGPYDYGCGAARPGRLTPKRARNLTLKTRRKDYLIYELDDQYNLLRVKPALNSKISSRDTEHCFELDDVWYSCYFPSGCPPVESPYLHPRIEAVKYKDGKPCYWASLGYNSVLLQCFEHVAPEKMIVTEYSYYPTSEYASGGHLTDPNAPMGAPGCPASRLCVYEIEPMYTDFSQWFKQTETP